MVQDAGADMIELVNGYTEAADLVELLAALKKEIKLPIITKVNGNWKDTETIARACDEAGADAITAMIPSPHLSGGHHHCRPLIGGHGYGYMTGCAYPAHCPALCA